MPNKSKEIYFERGFSHFVVLLISAVVIILVLLPGAKTIKQQENFTSQEPKNVLGEKQQIALTPCSGGGLTAAVYKDFQMQYTNENFLRVVNSKDLLKDVSQLKDLTCLQYLDATDQTVKGDIKDLKNLTNLEVFSLYSNPEVSGDICSLSNATKLRSLKFAFDPKITGDISCLKNLTNLETFAMTHTQISGDISVFANMPNLKAIYLSGTNTKGDICSLKNLTNLEELGIADEYPGNPDITGDLSCLNGLQKLKRVAIYNTKTTNCEAFTKSHPTLAQTTTESGKQGGGGCSKESMKTSVNYGQKYEKKIGKEELKKGKEFLKGHLALALEDTSDVSSFFGDQELFSDKVLTPEEVFKKIDKVTMDEVNAEARRLFVPERLNLAIIGPYESDIEFKGLLDK